MAEKNPKILLFISERDYDYLKIRWEGRKFPSNLQIITDNSDETVLKTVVECKPEISIVIEPEIYLPPHMYQVHAGQQIVRTEMTDLVEHCSNPSDINDYAQLLKEEIRMEMELHKNFPLV